MRGRSWILWAALGLACACGESVRHAGPPPSAAGTGGRGGEAAGAGGMTEPRCTDLVDDGTPLTPHCPSNASCPTASDCTRCEDCAGRAGIGAPLEDGTYELVDVVLFVSACGAFNGTTASGVLVVAGSTLTLTWTRPTGIGATAPGAAAYDFYTEGNELVLTETCPESSEATRVSYASAGGLIYFSSALPEEVAFSAVFERR